MEVYEIEEEDYFQHKALSSSKLSLIEHLLKRDNSLDNLREIKIIEGEAIIIGSLIDKILQDNSLIDKIIYVDNEYYNQYKENTVFFEYNELSSKINKLKINYDLIKDNYFDEINNRWKKGRNKEEINLIKEYESLLNKQESLYKVLVKVKELNDIHGLYKDLKEQDFIILNDMNLKDPKDTYDKIINLHKAILNCEEYNNLVKSCDEKKYQFALSFNVLDNECKALPDIVLLNHTDKILHLIDLKTTSLVSYKSYREKRYFRQLAFYGLPLKEFYKDYSFNYYILQARYSKDEYGYYYNCEINKISDVDISVGLWGGYLKHEFYSQYNKDKEWESTMFSPPIGVEYDDKRYTVYGIYHLIECYDVLMKKKQQDLFDIIK